jgi:hypothetical protein
MFLEGLGEHREHREGTAPMHSAHMPPTFSYPVIISVIDVLNIKLESYVSFAANNKYNTSYMLNSDEE